MSGIYIPGMEMPKGCFFCMFVKHLDPDTDKCILTNDAFDSTFRVVEHRRDNCPIIPIPDHGRLGDLDAAVEKLKRLREYHSDDSQSGVFIAHGISQCIEVLTAKEAPTIIPADVTDTNVGGNGEPREGQAPPLQPRNDGEEAVSDDETV